MEGGTIINKNNNSLYFSPKPYKMFKFTIRANILYHSVLTCGTSIHLKVNEKHGPWGGHKNYTIKIVIFYNILNNKTA